MPFVATSAGRVHYAERGSGVPVVLLHATLHDHRDFDAVTDRLAGRYRTIAVDWPGHGRSDPVPDATATRLADVLAEVMDALDLPPAVLIGNSVGGFAGARFAIDHPERTLALVLVDVGGFTGPSPVATVAIRLLGTPWIARGLLPLLIPGYMRARNDHDRAVAARAVARARTADGARTAAGIWRSFGAASYDLRAEVPRLTSPVLLVWGARDTILPLFAARRTHRAIPRATLHTLDTGHVVFASDPAGFLDVVEPFIDTAIPGSPP